MNDRDDRGWGTGDPGGAESDPSRAAGDAPSDELQFDRAEYVADSPDGALADGAPAAAAVLRCESCGGATGDSYYEINGKVACDGCRRRLIELRTGGSGVGRFARATLFGVVAGVVGALIYYAVLEITGLEIGLISILVGFMVGFAVAAGSHQRGGWLYQLLAVAITYCSIVSTYVPATLEMLVEEAPEWERQAEREAAAEAARAQGLEAPPPKELPPGLFGEEPAEEEAVTAEAAPAEETAPDRAVDPAPAGPEPDAIDLPPSGAPEEIAFEDLSPEEQRTAAAVGSLMVLIFAIALAFVVPFLMPFLAGFQGILGLLIIGFGVYQAWHLNRRQPLEISGPFAVGAQAAS